MWDYFKKSIYTRSLFILLIALIVGYLLFVPIFILTNFEIIKYLVNNYVFGFNLGTLFLILLSESTICIPICCILIIKKFERWILKG
ncbi:MAG: hypothetical protein LBD41_01740 [Clostridiales Family XIII bacterium]|jgi:hypothetical protein|nr:hypothetical protein [Clostridiales Family XIII bacterium]